MEVFNMAPERHMVSISGDAFRALHQVRERLSETQGRKLSLGDTISQALADFMRPSVDVDQMRRTLVAVTAQLVAQLRPELYEHFKGVAFNDRTGEAIVDFGGQGEDTRYLAKDPAEAVKN